MRLCSFEGCHRPHHGGGLCNTHYQRNLRGTFPSGPDRRRTRDESFPRLLDGYWELMDQGHSTADAASRLGVSDRTIYRALKWARQHGELC